MALKQAGSCQASITNQGKGKAVEVLCKKIMIIISRETCCYEGSVNRRVLIGSEKVIGSMDYRTKLGPRLNPHLLTLKEHEPFVILFYVLNTGFLKSPQA